MWSPYRYKVLYGGRGAGRSWSVARILLIRGMTNPTRILCTRQLQRSIQDSVHRLLSDQIVELKLPGYTITQREIRHTNGTVFLFEGLHHNTTKIKSIEGIDVCWVEEAEHVSEDSWNILIPTIRKAGSEIWINFNPDLPEDATFQRFVINTPPNSFVKKVGWEDNPWFPEILRIEKDYLYRVDQDAADWVWGGNTRKASDAQIFRHKWHVESFEPQPGWQGPYHGLDFGFANDPSALVRLWTNRRKLYVERESWNVGLDLHKSREVWLRDVPNAHRHVIRADSSRPESISYHKQHGFPRIQAAVKWPGSVDDGIAYLRAYEEIVIHPRCTHAAMEFRLYSFKVDKNDSSVILPEVVDKHNHVPDAIRYALAPMIRARKKATGYSGTTYTSPN
jgi:phage terminase large subunit